jgi:hypothetical protein
MPAIRPTASKLALLEACAFPFRPELDIVEEPVGVGALTGTGLHLLIDAAIEEKPEPAIPDGADAEAVQQMFAMWKAWWATFAGTLWWRAEVPVAIDLETGRGRILPSKGHRDYSDASPTEIPGTADVVGLDGDMLHVGDWKSGHPDYLEEAITSRQLLGLVLPLYRSVPGVKRARAFIAHVAPDGVRIDSAIFDELDLDAGEAELREQVAAIPTSTPAPGAHCRWCPARALCPESERGLAALVEETPAAALAAILRGQEITADRAALAARALPLLDELGGRVRKMLTAEAKKRGGSILIGKGRALKVISFPRESISKSSINEALGDVDADAVITRLRDAGAFKQSTVEQLREVKA